MNPRLSLFLALGAAAVLAAVSCASPGPEGGEPAAPAAAGAPAAAAPLEVPSDPAVLAGMGEEHGLHNLARVAPGLFRGAQPEGDASFALMARLGIRNALSVDGSKPDVEGAARHGIRYIHIPIEYSGITRDQEARIAKAALTVDGPLFVHCHHGKHRGPAASSIAWMTREGVSPEEAVADMKRAGTSPKYAGLFAAVREFEPCTAGELAAVRPSDLPPIAPTPPLVDHMVSIDESHGRLMAVEKAGWKTPPSHPDVVPAHEARILAEYFRELGRTEAVSKRPADFRGWVGEAEQAAWDLEKAIEAGDGAAAHEALDRAGNTCNACHGVYRNRKATW